MQAPHRSEARERCHKANDTAGGQPAAQETGPVEHWIAHTRRDCCTPDGLAQVLKSQRRTVCGRQREDV